MCRTLSKLRPGESLMFLARAELTQDHSWPLYLLTFNLKQGSLKTKYLEETWVSSIGKYVFSIHSNYIFSYTSHHKINKVYCYLRKVVGINEIFLWLDLVNFGYDKTWKMQYHNHKALYSMRRWSENESNNLSMGFLSRNYTGSYWNEVQWYVPFCLYCFDVPLISQWQGT